MLSILVALHGGLFLIGLAFFIVARRQVKASGQTLKVELVNYADALGEIMAARQSAGTAEERLDSDGMMPFKLQLVGLDSDLQGVTLAERRQALEVEIVGQYVQWNGELQKKLSELESAAA
jgi:hypothetical protein